MKPFKKLRRKFLYGFLATVASLSLGCAENPHHNLVESKGKALEEQVSVLLHNQGDESMIIRKWRARTTSTLEQEFLVQARTVIIPYLQTFSGYKGAYFTKRKVDDSLEILVLTFWESRAAVQEFAGDEESHAYISPEIAETLTSYDSTSDHFEVLINDIVD